VVSVWSRLSLYTIWEISNFKEAPKIQSLRHVTVYILSRFDLNVTRYFTTNKRCIRSDLVGNIFTFYRFQNWEHGMFRNRFFNMPLASPLMLTYNQVMVTRMLTKSFLLCNISRCTFIPHTKHSWLKNTKFICNAISTEGSYYERVMFRSSGSPLKSFLTCMLTIF
jgi:hypothetical protein